MTRAEAAKFYGIKLNTLIKRLWLGWPIEEAIKPAPSRYRDPKPPPKPRGRSGGFVTPYGRMGLMKAAKVMGLSQKTLSTRIYICKWSQEDALNTPPYGIRGLHFIIEPEEFRRRVREIIEGETEEANGKEA